MDLFAEQEDAALDAVRPLPVRMRPRSLDEFVGQEAFLGPGKLLRRLLDAGRLTSAIFHGPPGCGKTTLARIIANHTGATFETLHAAEAGVKDVRRVIDSARGQLAATGRGMVLFLDEIHRFNRAQQDVLLRDVEDGVLILVGATTENPHIAINTPLVSRSNLFEFQPLTAEHIGTLLRRALADTERGLGATRATIDDDALIYIAERADGDARRALAAIEVAVLSQSTGDGPPHVSLEIAADSMQQKALRYDAAGDTHYDVASALIKSMRGSDPDATIYWLARMLESGEDPRFIARRIAIAASEDVGNADPQAAILASAAAQITQFIGLPECQFALAQAAVYVACAPKSNAVTKAIGAACEDVRTKPTIPVPLELRDPTYRRAEQQAADCVYRSPHDTDDGFLPRGYLGVARTYYNPTQRGFEGRIRERLQELRRRIAAARPAEHSGEA